MRKKKMSIDNYKMFFSTNLPKIMFFGICGHPIVILWNLNWKNLLYIYILMIFPLS